MKTDRDREIQKKSYNESTDLELHGNISKKSK